MQKSRFTNRADAGRILAAGLRGYVGKPDSIVLALPRGGVPVAFEVAQTLDVPLDVFLVRKLGVPGHEELAMGACAEGGFVFLHQKTVQRFGIEAGAIRHVILREQAELQRREYFYRTVHPKLNVCEKIVIIVDDGVATGSTMYAAIHALRARHPSSIVVAVPVGAPEAIGQLGKVADEVVCTQTPPMLEAVGSWYADFTQTSDDEVSMLLQQAAQRDALYTPH
jgi:putative phosphoribosyl transferase